MAAAANASVKILRAMGEMHSLGMEDQSKQLVCLFSGYGHPNSSSFAAGMRLLRSQGLIMGGSSKGLRLTEKGVRAVPRDLVPSATTEEAHRRWLEIVGSKTTNRDKLEQLWDILKDGNAHTVADLAEALGYGHVNSSPFAALIRRLKDCGVATRTNGVVQLTDVAFPFGRP
jgi:predicted transcriptional regulator